MSTITVRPSQAAQTILIDRSSVIDLCFQPEGATLERAGADLLFTFPDGGSITLKGFFAGKELPTLELVDGTSYSGKEFLHSFNPEISTEAGLPPSDEAAGHGGTYDDATGDLLAGVDRFGSLGTDYWDRATKTVEYPRGPLTGGSATASSTRTAPLPATPGEPEEPPVPPNPPIAGAVPTIGPDAGLVLNEANLPGGSLNAGGNGPAVSGTVAFVIDAGCGLASITINGVAYALVDGRLQGFSPITDPDGSFHSPRIEPHADGTFTLTLTYTLESAHNHAPEQGRNEEATAVLDIYATDMHGATTGTVHARVSVIDDVPTAGPDTAALNEETHSLSMDAAHGVLVNDSLGADCAGTEKRVSGVAVGGNANVECTDNVGAEVQGRYGTLVLNADGGYTYTLTRDVAPNEKVDDVFTYSIKDTDGDWKTTTLTVTTTGTNEKPSFQPGPDPSHGTGGGAAVTLHEDGLAGGSGSADSGPHGIGGEGVFRIDSHKEGLSSLSVGGHDIPLNGTGLPVTVSEPGAVYTVIITGVEVDGSGVYRVNYTYALKEAYNHPADVDSITFDCPIHAVDKSGDPLDGKLSVTILDDGPVAAHDLGTLHTQDVNGVPHWVADGNVLTSEGSRATAQGGGEPAWVGVDTGEIHKDVLGADGAALSRFQYTNVNGEKVWVDIPQPTESNANPSATVSDLKDGGSITVYRDGTYHYEAECRPPTINPVSTAVEVEFGSTVQTNGFSFQGFSGIATTGPDGGLAGVLTLQQVLASRKADMTYSTLGSGGIGVYSGGDDLHGIGGTAAAGEGVLIGTGDIWPQGLQTMTIGLDGYTGDALARIAVFGLNGHALAPSAYTVTIAGGVITISVNSSGGDNDAIGHVLLVADNADNGATNLHINSVSGVYAEKHLVDNNIPRVDITYELKDADGDTSTAELRLEHDGSVFIVGGNQDDRPGAASPFSVAEGPYPPDHGAIIGGSGNDILVGDSNGVTVTGHVVENYNICVVLDLSTSMNDKYGDQTMSRLNVAKQSLTKLMDDVKNYAGKINVQLLVFGAGAHSEGLALEGNDPAAYIEQLDAIITNIAKLRAISTTNYEAAFNSALAWFSDTGANGAANPAYKDYINKVLFLTDGLPTYSTQGVARGDGSNGSPQMDPSDLLDAHAAFQKLMGLGMGIQVAAIGMGSEIRDDVLRFFDNTTGNGFLSESNNGSIKSDPLVHGDVSVNGWLFGDVEIVTKPGDLDAAIARGLDIHLLNMSNDVLIGGAGDDILFGDVLNTDTLAKNSGLNLPAGSGWEVFRALETDPDANWTRDDTKAYIRNHLDEVGASQESTKGGHDMLIGGTGNDTIYGQSGNDLVFGGDIHFKGLHGEAAFGLLVNTVGGDTEQIIGYLKDHVNEIGRGTAADGDNHLNGGHGNDFLIGGGGNDLIYGGRGDDIMFGGAGNDTFAWKAEEYDGGRDTILDFNLNEDKLGFASLFGDGPKGAIPEADILSAIRGGRIDLTATDDMHLNIRVETSSGTQNVDITLEGQGVGGEYLDALRHSHQADPGGDMEKAALLQQILTNAGG